MRVILLGFNHTADALWSGAADTAANSFTDPLVRCAANHAIDMAKTNQLLMSGMAEPASQLLPEGLPGWSGAHAPRPADDPVATRALVAEAGHESGVSPSDHWHALAGRAERAAADDAGARLEIKMKNPDYAPIRKDRP